MTDDEREEYEERAAIMQYCGGYSRSTAEHLAMKRVFESTKDQPDLFTCN